MAYRYQHQSQSRPPSKDSTESKYLFNPRWPDRLKGKITIYTHTDRNLTRLHVEHCEVRGLGEPKWQEVSDRRGKLDLHINLPCLLWRTPKNHLC